jgi:hypothetical protein
LLPYGGESWTWCLAEVAHHAVLAEMEERAGPESYPLSVPLLVVRVYVYCSDKSKQSGETSSPGTKDQATQAQIIHIARAEKTDSFFSLLKPNKSVQ